MSMSSPTFGIISGASYSDPFAIPAKDKTDDVSKEDFLLLLVEQLKNQDPLEPMDGTDFTAQLAQFSSLEQQTTMNDNLALLQDYSATLNRLSALDMIGKNVEFDGDGAGTAQITGDGQPVALNFELADSAQEVTVDIYNEAGGRVATLDLGYHDLGVQTYNWNGKDSDGNALAEGHYSYEVVARDEMGQLVTTSVNGNGEVQGVETDPANGNTILVLVDGTRVGIDQVMGVSAPG